MNTLSNFTHKRIYAMDNWKFKLHSDDNSAEFTNIQLPHDWQIFTSRTTENGSQGFYPHNGLGIYEYNFTVPIDWENKLIHICFDGVQRFSSIYLNNTLVGRKNYGYVPFSFDISELLNVGEINIIRVEVDNRDDGGDRWYSGEGIYRNVWFLTDNLIHIDIYGIKANYKIIENTNNAEISLKVKVINKSKVKWNGTILVNIFDRSGNGIEEKFSICADNEDTEFTLNFEMQNIIRWELDNPHLYEIKVELQDCGILIDTQSTVLGFRDIVIDNERGMFLNGRNIKLYGFNLHHDGGAFGAAVPIRVWERRFKLIKEMGCNAIRCSHNPQAHEFYDLCDKYGFLVIDELYDKWKHMYYKNFFDTDKFDDLHAMVDRDYNHPSIFMWSMGNELIIQYSEEFYSILSEMVAECKSIDPYRPVSLALNGYLIHDFHDEKIMNEKLEATIRYSKIVDIAMMNYMENFYELLRNRGMEIPIIGSEVFMYYRHGEIFEENNRYNNKMYARSPFNDVENKDYVIGGFVWAGVDYLGESSGFPCRGWTGTPIDSASFRKLYSWHFETQWKHEPLVKITVFDEDEPCEMANANWGFPQLSGHWNFKIHSKMMHVAVMSNCEKVYLYANNGMPIIALTNPDDHMAHFNVGYFPGKLRAVGYRDETPVCEDIIYTSEKPHKITFKFCEKTLIADGHEIIHAEVNILDKFGQKWTLTRPNVKFKLEGEAEIMIIDNGDFCSEDEFYRKNTCSLFHGHAIVVIRSTKNAGKITLTAEVDGFSPEIINIESTIY